MALPKRIQIASITNRSCLRSSSRSDAPHSRQGSLQKRAYVQSTEKLTQKAVKVVSDELDSISDNALSKKYGNLALHPDLEIGALSNTQLLTHDVLAAFPCQLVRSSLEGHLPISEALSTEPDLLHLGYQQIFFRPALTPKQLLPDGTDTRFLPGRSSVWQYRLWAGGSAAYSLDNPYNLTEPAKTSQLEVVQDIRIHGKDRPEKVFVTIRRLIAKSNRSTKGMTGIKTINDLLQSKTPPLEEQYTLCFLRNPPGDSTSRAGITPPDGALFSHTMIPDSNLLFQFSALTYNAHKIHLSPEYARQEYGMKHIVVHGPFTQLLLIEFMRRLLKIHGRVQGQDTLFPKSISYTNLRPLYADEPMTFCCKPLKLADDQDPWQARSWRVWIETGRGETASLAVKAIIEIGVTQ